MTEKDLDIAIEKCERIMEFDTRTLKDRESENGYIFDKVYELLKFLRGLKLDTDTNDTISRQAAITEFSCCELTPDGGIDANYAIDFLKQMPSAQSEPKSYRMGYQAGYAAAQRWIPCSERLPKENDYVLVWCGEVKIARIIRGISEEQRAEMQEGVIDDPVSYGWNLSNGYFKVKRSETYRACDEYGNNKVAYCWDCIYGKMFGQDVKAWMPLPEPYREEINGERFV